MFWKKMDEVVRFGKYYGKSWEEVYYENENYVRWVLCTVESGGAFQGVDARWVTWAKQLGMLDVLSGMSVTDVARRRARDAAQLSSVARVAWVETRVGEPLPCPDECSPSKYGTFVDYVVRHHMSGGEFRDDRTEKILAEEKLPADKRARRTGSFSRADGTAERSSARRTGWLARLSEMLAEALPSGHVVANPIVGTKFPGGKLIRGDADLLVGDELVEVKASAHLSHEYVSCQTLVYAALLRMRGVPVRGVRVLNVATATVTRADLAAWDHAELLYWLEEILVAW